MNNQIEPHEESNSITFAHITERDKEEPFSICSEYTKNVIT